MIVSDCTLVKERILPSGMHKKHLLLKNNQMRPVTNYMFCTAEQDDSTPEEAR
jgi:hypothetical protein